MIRRDLQRARDAWIDAAPRGKQAKRRQSDFLAATDGDGRVVDFHALRATYITFIVKGGASVRKAQELARHCDPRLTMNVYTKLGIHDLAGALKSLLDVVGDKPRRRRATGTE